jgi:hypothetical protein
MKMMKSAGFAGSLLLVGALVFTGGCGYKNSPIPPQEIVPKVIEDLRYTVTDTGALLTWTYPTETVMGKDIEEISSFELFRSEVALSDYCSTCPIPFADPIIIPGGITAAETRRVAEYESGMLRSGYKYFFKVRSRTNWWASSNDSNIVTFIYHTPAAAPVGLEVIPGENRLTLQWQPVTAHIDGKPVDLPLSYQVMRSTDSKDFVEIGGPLAARQFVDTTVETGKTYSYRVKSNLLFEDSLMQGSVSDTISAVVADITPPAVVDGVRVVSSNTDNRIFWEGVEDEDLAGYKIYRRPADRKKAELIGEVGATQTLFVDENPLPETAVYYTVTAIDNANPANESKMSKEATTRY